MYDYAGAKGDSWETKNAGNETLRVDGFRPFNPQTELQWDEKHQDLLVLEVRHEFMLFVDVVPCLKPPASIAYVIHMSLL